MHFSSRPLFQPLGYDLPVFNFLLDHDFFWDKRSPRIKLFQKTGHDLGTRVLFGNLQIEMVSSYEFAAPDKEYLCHSVLPILGNCHNILVLPVLVRNLLPFTDPFYALDQVSVLGCILEIHFLGCSKHFFFQLF